MYREDVPTIIIIVDFSLLKTEPKIYTKRHHKVDREGGADARQEDGEALSVDANSRSNLPLLYCSIRPLCKKTIAAAKCQLDESAAEGEEAQSQSSHV
jgi:hypothetical protein